MEQSADRLEGKGNQSRRLCAVKVVITKTTAALESRRNLEKQTEFSSYASKEKGCLFGTAKQADSMHHDSLKREVGTVDELWVKSLSHHERNLNAQRRFFRNGRHEKIMPHILYIAGDAARLLAVGTWPLNRPRQLDSANEHLPDTWPDLIRPIWRIILMSSASEPLRRIKGLMLTLPPGDLEDFVGDAIDAGASPRFFSPRAPTVDPLARVPLKGRPCIEEPDPKKSVQDRI